MLVKQHHSRPLELKAMKDTELWQHLIADVIRRHVTLSSTSRRMKMHTPKQILNYS